MRFKVRRWEPVSLRQSSVCSLCFLVVGGGRAGRRAHQDLCQGVADPQSGSGQETAPEAFWEDDQREMEWEAVQVPDS